MDDNALAIIGLVVICVGVIVAGPHMSQAASNIVSAAGGSLGTLLTAKVLQK